MTTDKGRLIPGSLLLFLKLRFYYEQLNQDSTFLADLRLLVESLPGDLPSQGILEAASGQSVPLEVMPQFTEFSERWSLRLPGGTGDLWFTAWRVRNGKTLALYQTNAGVGWILDSPYIAPYNPPSFEYSPMLSSHAWVKEKANEEAEKVRASILEQAEALEQQAVKQGWNRLPPAYHDTDSLRAGARKLYLRAVKGLSWGRIALDEKVGRGSVTKQVRR